jgi:hypothetical protein
MDVVASTDTQPDVVRQAILDLANLELAMVGVGLSLR